MQANEPSPPPVKTRSIKPRSKDWSWLFWFLLPIYPFGQRRTLRQEIIPNTLWTFEQVQGIFYVIVPIRMTIVRLSSGGLLVYAPVAPTPECIRLVRDLETQHGSVKYIILPTTSGLEHKIFVPAFARHFPQAQIFVARSQWSYPIQLPLSWLGFPRHRTQLLPTDSSQTPFATDFDYAILGPIALGLGSFEEVAFFHRSSRTVLVTDTIVSVSADPPPIVTLEPYPLLFHAKDSAAETAADTPTNRRKGWQRIALFAFYFRPHALNVMPLQQAWQQASQAPDRSRQAYFGLYPFDWQPNWQHSFEALRGNGRLFVAPILQTLILKRSAAATLDWSYQVASWNFQRLIPCHFDAPLTTTPRQFLQAFAFLQPNSALDRTTALEANLPLPAEDFAFLQALETNLDRIGIIGK